jgi:hypothetical protein
MPPMQVDMHAAAPVAARPPLITSRLAMLIVAQSAFGFGWSLYLLQPKFLATQLNASPEVIGRITAMGGIAAIATIPLVAHGIDRYGRRPFFWFGSALLSVLSIGYLRIDAVSGTARSAEQAPDHDHSQQGQTRVHAIYRRRCVRHHGG